MKKVLTILLVALGSSFLLSSCYYERFDHGYRGYGGYHRHHDRDGDGYGDRGYGHHRY